MDAKAEKWTRAKVADLKARLADPNLDDEARGILARMRQVIERKVQTAATGRGREVRGSSLETLLRRGEIMQAQYDEIRSTLTRRQAGGIERAAFGMTWPAPDAGADGGK